MGRRRGGRGCGRWVEEDLEIGVRVLEIVADGLPAGAFLDEGLKGGGWPGMGIFLIAD